MPSQFFVLFNNKFKSIVFYHQLYPSWSLKPFLQPPFCSTHNATIFLKIKIRYQQAPIQSLAYLDKNQDMSKAPFYEIPTLELKQDIEIRGIDECGTR